MAPSDLIALLDRYERTLIRYACSIVGDLDSARDVVQETFIKVAQMETQNAEWSAATSPAAGSPHGSAEALASARGMRKEEREAGSVNGEEQRSQRSAFPVPHLEAWLFTVTRNGALDHVRKHSRIIPMTLPDDRPCAGPGPSTTLEQRENADSIFELLDALSPNQREVIRLKFQNDLSYREIAEVTKLSVTNIGFLIHTGLKKLRALLREQPAPDFDLPIRTAS
jgi:RNA polymerase sigma-70 factor (ECF subfamily)